MTHRAARRWAGPGAREGMRRPLLHDDDGEGGGEPGSPPRSQQARSAARTGEGESKGSPRGSVLLEMVRAMRGGGVTSRRLPEGGIEAVPTVAGDAVAKCLRDAGITNLPQLLL
eukprot:CAMPEP_0169472266 /NCGR_PEP_ID=MMETSP1042-20121227/25058_1 /TAXON_ID=464988 /ORGANISM="Hemiselmis andersenii, Strain CCMP1180" /LENGTH=113 /DNA_ID=CAMNT_0009586071 /DNA_START=176 /DNA_END=513 /DNA_ORIENTATION=-